MEKFNAKQFAGRMIAAHLEKMEVPDAAKLKQQHKISQTDAILVHAYLTMQRAELTERFTREKKKKLVGEKETEATK